MICRSAACKLAGKGALPRQGTISCLDTVASRRRLQTVHWTVCLTASPWADATLWQIGFCRSAKASRYVALGFFVLGVVEHGGRVGEVLEVTRLADCLRLKNAV